MHSTAIITASSSELLLLLDMIHAVFFDLPRCVSTDSILMHAYFFFYKISVYATLSYFVIEIFVTVPIRQLITMLNINFLI